jgi:hypothetical protein
MKSFFAGLLVAGAVSAWMPDCRAAQRDEPQDEVLVQSTWIRAVEIRKKSVEVEDRFFAEYNDLNKQDDFDIHGINEARAGTRFNRRYCTVAYEDNARQEEGAAARVSEEHARGDAQELRSW